MQKRRESELVRAYICCVQCVRCVGEIWRGEVKSVLCDGVNYRRRPRSSELQGGLGVISYVIL